MKSLVFIHSWYIDYFLNYFSLLKYLWRRQWHPTPVLLPGKSHGRRSLVGCSPWGRWRLDTTERLHFQFSLSGTGEENGNSLQYSCLENPRDREAWWATIYGVAQCRTRLKQLSSSSSSNGKSDRFYWGALKSLQMMTAAMKLKDVCPWKKSYDQPK